MGCGCGGGSNGQVTPVVEINSAPLSTCGAPQCNAAVNPCASAASPGVPTPYYLQAPAVQQTNCQQFITQQFSTTVKTSTSWNVPECGGVASATFTLPNVTSVLVGSNLWNEAYGYFEVISWNSATQQVTVVNNCIEGNVAAGTMIPACSEFLVNGPICDCSGGSNLEIYVAIDFTAPPVSACINITVTGVEGLIVGKNVQIGTGIYRVSAIVSNEIITICNDGSGITPGTAVYAKNGAEKYQYPITLIDSNPCTSTAVGQGTLLVCDGSGIIAPLDGSLLGTVPVLVDATTNAVQFKSLDVPYRDCTVLAATLTYVPAVSSYVLNVANSAGFTIGDVLQVGSRTERLTVTAIPSINQISVTVYPTPGAIVTIPAGTSVCEQYCCDALFDVVNCGEQAVVGSIPLAFLTTSAIGLTATFEQRVADGTSILRLNVPQGDCLNQQYNLAAEVYVYAVTDADASVFPGVGVPIRYHEVEVAWVVGAANPLAPRTENKMVWNTWDDEYQVGGVAQPSTQAAVWSQLISALNPGDGYSAVYHGGFIRTTRRVTAGDVMDLALIYKQLIGEYSVPAFIYPTRFMISGIWELTRV